MVQRDEPWPPGTPCWIDLLTNDPEGARAFYAGLFGWTYEVGGPETGHYAMALVDGRPAAGIGAAPPEFPLPAAWTTYLASADVDATAEAVVAAGGTIRQPAIDVADFGRMAVATDPSGATFGVWQAGRTIGCQIADEPGTLIWNEVLTRDYPGAKDFYARVFGVTFTDIGDGTFEFAEMKVDGNTVGGVGLLPADTPDAMPSFWRHYIAVPSVDATTTAAQSAGARALTEPHDSPFGRWAMLADPQGAAFCVIAPPPTAG